MSSSRKTPPTTRQLTTLVEEVTDRTSRTVGSMSDDVARRLRPLAEGVEHAVSTALAQTRSAASRAASTIDARRREATGQIGAQAQRVGDEADSARVALLDDAANAVAGEPSGPPAALEDRTKAELYDEARARDIEGRSAMSKDELIAALRRS